MDNPNPDIEIEDVPNEDSTPIDEQREYAPDDDGDDDSGNLAPNAERTDDQNANASRDIEELVRYVASKLVNSDENIVVESEFRGGTVYVSLRVPEEEMGRVIGREGRTAKAIRTLVSIAGARHSVHARLDIDG